MLFAELRSETTNMHIDRSGAAVIVIAPHPAEEHFSRKHFARVLHEEFQQLVFHVGGVRIFAITF